MSVPHTDRPQLADKFAEAMPRTRTFSWADPRAIARAGHGLAASTSSKR